MRIAYVLHQFFPEFGSGTERVTLALARMQQRAGHHVEVLACSVDAAARAGARPAPDCPGALLRLVDGVPVTLLPRERLPATAETSLAVDAAVAADVAAWLGARRIDVVHVLHAMRMGSALAGVARSGLPFVVTATDFFYACHRINLVDAAGRACEGPRGGRACAERCLGPAWDEAALQTRHRAAATLLGSARACLAPSAFVAERLRAAFPGLTVHVVPHGIDLLASIAAAQRPSPLPAQRPALRLAFVGSIVPQKGLATLLDALALRPQLEVELVVAGGLHGDAVYRREIEARLRAEPRARALGALPPEAVAALLLHVDLLVLPSLVPESYALVVHEAAAAGVPALVSDLGAPAAAIRAHGAGGVAAAGDAAAWAEAIAQWCGDAALRQRWRDAVRVPPRIEEEAFFYERLYRQACTPA